MPKLAAALQHREGTFAAGGGGSGSGDGAERAACEREQQPVSRSGRAQRDAVVLAAGHLTGGAQVDESAHAKRNMVLSCVVSEVVFLVCQIVFFQKQCSALLQGCFSCVAVTQTLANR